MTDLRNHGPTWPYLYSLIKQPYTSQIIFMVKYGSPRVFKTMPAVVAASATVATTMFVLQFNFHTNGRDGLDKFVLWPGVVAFSLAKAPQGLCLPRRNYLGGRRCMLSTVPVVCGCHCRAPYVSSKQAHLNANAALVHCF